MLYCPYYIEKEIMNNPDKYYMKPPTEEDKKEIKDKLKIEDYRLQFFSLKTLGFNDSKEITSSLLNTIIFYIHLFDIFIFSIYLILNI